MSGNQVIPRAGRIGGFCGRHLLALAVTVVAGCAFWTVIYGILLLWALFTKSDIGGPWAYPIGLLFMLVVGVATSLGLLLPATVLGAWFARRRGLSLFAQVSLSVAFLAGLCLILGGVVWAAGWQARFIDAAVSCGSLFVALLLPLGLYGWAAQSGPLLLSLWRQARGRSIE